MNDLVVLRKLLHSMRKRLSVVLDKDGVAYLVYNDSPTAITAHVFRSVDSAYNFYKGLKGTL